MPFNASNKPGTCVWCGRKLRWECNTVTELDPKKARCGRCHRKTSQERAALPMNERTECAEIVDGHPCRGLTVEFGSRIVSRERRYDQPGPGGNGLFDTGACMQAFGLAMARINKRFKPTSFDHVTKRCEHCGDERAAVPKLRSSQNNTYWCRNIPACSRRARAARKEAAR